MGFTKMARKNSNTATGNPAGNATGNATGNASGNPAGNATGNPAGNPPMGLLAMAHNGFGAFGFASGALAPQPAPQPVMPKRGAATLARWARGNVTGHATLTAGALASMALPQTTVITVNVATNPKSATSATRFAASYATRGVITKGAQITLAQLANTYATHAYGNKQMYMDLAWDCNHGFVLIAGVNGQ